ncbi:MAG: universal stress protein [Chloroflexi bacterium]|nr:universal stress protein [Chloroflexota bacterium]
MFKHLLIPLDGSRLAETALPSAAHLAETLQASVTLLHVIEQNAPREVHSEPHLTNPPEAQAYLDRMASRAFPAHLHVERHVHTTEVSDVARSITAHASEMRPDLIVMCTHGRGGLRQLLFGSIAQQVIALGTTPILLIRPTEAGAPPAFACRLILVPLDGDPAHEQGLPVAVGLAQACAAALHLVMVVPTLTTLFAEQAAAAKLLPQAMTALLDIDQQNAEEYLGNHLPPLREAGLTATAEVARGEPAPIITGTARHAGADLIVLGTHGKAGMGAFWSGSVAPKVTMRSPVPVLLVPLHRPGAAH